ncbi:hypothetical protein MSIMFB_04598 [Mycobacterium simulans]|uniref:Uncharacterized protein n=1 Tax=Mycobacterium simulans TaxID=627089 RepID=A0A7Z7IRB1_9MYCO|nr:hypothetical protein MSIMFB_04598 [Mycobacterium simulans]
MSVVTMQPQARPQLSMTAATLAATSLTMSTRSTNRDEVRD